MSAETGRDRERATCVLRQGYLRKLKTMKKKYFVLKSENWEASARLEYYDSEKKWRSGGCAKRVIPLKSCFNINRRLDTRHKHVIALYTREDVFGVVLEGEEELRGWLAALLLLHHPDDGSDDLAHPTQHVWQVNVHPKGLGASKHIVGLYNVCLTEHTLALVKIKGHHVHDPLPLDRVEFSLRNIRRCGNSECFFYMEVGRQTATGAGELWMHTDDANIAQSMHATILHAMSSCSKECEPEVCGAGAGSGATGAVRARCSSATERRGAAGAGAWSQRRQTYCERLHDRATLPAHAPPSPRPLDGVRGRCDSVPCRAPPSALADMSPEPAHPPAGPPAPAGPSTPAPAGLSAPSTTPAPAPTLAPAGSLHFDDSMDEPDCMEWSRDRVPSFSSPPPPALPAATAAAAAAAYCVMTPPAHCGSVQHSRTSSLVEEAEGYLTMSPALPPHADSGYVDMARGGGGGGGGGGAAGTAFGGVSPALSSGSVASGTPSTDARFAEYQLERVAARILADEELPAPHPRAHSLGSRPPPPEHPRTRAFSTGARPPRRHHAPSLAPHPHHKTSSAPLLAPNSSEDLMELDFSHNASSSPRLAQTPPSGAWHMPPPPPPTASFAPPAPSDYVDMSPVSSQFAAHMEARREDGYVEMGWGEGSRPLVIQAGVCPASAACAADGARGKKRAGRGRGGDPEPPGDMEHEWGEEGGLGTLREIEERRDDEPMEATEPEYVVLGGGGGGGGAGGESAGLNYAALDLDAVVPCAGGAAVSAAPGAGAAGAGAGAGEQLAYTQIDWARTQPHAPHALD